MLKDYLWPRFARSHRPSRARGCFEAQVSTERLERRLLLFAQFNSWESTATDGAGLNQGDAATLTWSIVPDGTPVGAMGGVSGESSDPSNLVAFLSGVYGTVTADTNYTDEVWFSHFQSTFARWSELSGITYVYVGYDDGASLATAPGVLGVRADVRIGGHRIDGNSGVLAYNFYPENGDMVIDTVETSYPGTGNAIRLRNMLAHESGHGLGMQHVYSSSSAILMEAYLSTSFDGPQFDDVLGIQQIYGDYYEKNGGNDTAAKATPLGALGAGQTLSVGVDTVSTVILPSQTGFVSIDDASDIDVYSFTTTSATTVNIQLNPTGPSYVVGTSAGNETTYNASSQSDLTLRLLGTNGTTVLATANAGGLGVSESISSFSVPGAGTYYVKITGSAVYKVQAYRLNVTDVASAALTMTLNTGSVSEAAGANAATMTVTRSGDLNTALIVTLASDDTTEATVPLTVTIPANQPSATFTIAAIDDLIVDGAQLVMFTASAAGFVSGTNILDVMDDDFSVEENTMAVTTIPAIDPEGGLPTFGISGGADESLFSIDPINGVLNGF